MNGPTEVSIVVPVYNEKGSLEALRRQIAEAFEKLRVSYEVLFIDDGSTDGSAKILDRLAEENPDVGVIHMRRNFGKAAALKAGFERARGQVIITMDADLQDDPKEIPRFLAKLQEGCDLVSGWRRIRHDPVGKTLPSKLFNVTVSWVSSVPLHDINCGLKAYRREVLSNLGLYGEMHRFLPVLAHWRGFKVTEIPVEHRERRFGVSKYGIERLTKGFFDLLTVLLMTRFSSRPLHLLGGAGLVFAAAGLAILAYLSALWFLGQGPIGTRPLLFLGLLLTMVGVQLVSIGLLGELIIRQRQSEGPDCAVEEFRPPRTGDEQL